MIPLIVALQIAATSGGLAPSARPADSAAAINMLRRDAGDFLWAWRFHWEASERLRHEIQGELFPIESYFPKQPRPSGNRTVRDRVNHLHCHPDARSGFPYLPTTIREGYGSLRAVCPRWSMPEAPAHDERLSIDDAIAESLRTGVRYARGELIARLEAAAADLPGDPWIAGQRVRFAIDQRDSVAAMRAIHDCRAGEWWCAALAGYAKYAFGDIAGADSSFTTALAAMTPTARCAWGDLSLLLDEQAQKGYAPLSCAQKDSVAARFWWLSDPLYTESGNERRAEHFSRLVMIAVHRDVSPGDRWNWKDGQGGRSLTEMLVRYGWPSQAWWSGPLEDRSHYSYLMVWDESEREAGVFTTHEYSFGRFHTVPEWSAIVDPFHSVAGAWSIAAPRDRRGRADEDWWPQEHYARSNGPLLSIPDQQTGVFRRGSQVLLAVASDVSHVGLERGMARNVNAALVVTPAPDTMEITKKTIALDSMATWRMLIAPRPSILSIEARTTWPQSPTARTRFGIVPPPPLSAMGQGEIAISEPVLIRAPAPDERPASDPDVALGRMLGSTRVMDLQRVGVYWETYGIAANDSVDVAVKIDRLGQPGMFRRLGNALHIADRVDGSATVSWKEPQPAAATTTIPGPVPIQGRNVTIDLSRLVPDKYSVTVIVSRGGGQIASASRQFEIVKTQKE